MTIRFLWNLERRSYAHADQRSRDKEKPQTPARHNAKSIE
jgi:hypothetical protein